MLFKISPYRKSQRNIMTFFFREYFSNFLKLNFLFHPSGNVKFLQPWVKVERVEIKDVRLPLQLQRAMAAEAEAAREARARVIAAEGEQKSSGALKAAAEVIQQSPHALQLRYLQTLTGISTEQNSTIIFPMPISVSNFA